MLQVECFCPQLLMDFKLPTIMKRKQILTIIIAGIALCVSQSCRKQPGDAPGPDSPLSISNLNVLVTALPADQYMSLTFINESTGFAVSNHGLIVKTTDGGSHWQKVISLGDGMLLTKIQFVDASNGFVIAGDSDGGYLFKTTDGGASWAKKEFDPLQPGVPNDMYFLNANLGFIIGPNLFIKTTDGGNTWSRGMQDDHYNFNRINFRSPTEGYASCNEGKYFHTKDGGNTWELKSVNSPMPLRSIYFGSTKTYIDAGAGLLDLSNPSSLTTLPAGANQLLFLSDTRCVAVGEHYEGGFYSYGDVLVTNDFWKTNEKKTFSPSQAYTFKCIAKMSDHKAMLLGYGTETIAATISW